MDADVVSAAKSVGAALDGAGIDYAIGGALALGVHGALRATRDVDVNVFCGPEKLSAALAALETTGVQVNHAAALDEAGREGWFSCWLGAVRIDVFVPSIDFSWEASRRRVQRSFAGTSLWFLSVEALCVFKLLFFRTKDLADLEQLLLTVPVDSGWVRGQVASMMGEDDPRIAAWDRMRSVAPSR